MLWAFKCDTWILPSVTGFRWFYALWDRELSRYRSVCLPRNVGTTLYNGPDVSYKPSWLVVVLQQRHCDFSFFSRNLSTYLGVTVQYLKVVSAMKQPGCILWCQIGWAVNYKKNITWSLLHVWALSFPLMDCSALMRVYKE